MIDGVRKIGAGAAILSLAAAVPAAGATGRPELFSKLVQCRSIADPGQRLACYDAQVGALDAAEEKKDVVVMDREQVRETRRSLFGFALPNIGIFGGKKEVVEDVDKIDGTIATARPIAGDRWSIVLANDAGTWETTSPVRFDPRAGQAIHISKAAMGSYLGSFGSNKGIRCRRVN